MDITMHELLAGNAAQTNAVESSKVVSGSIVMDSQANVLSGSKLSMDLRTLQSDRQIRDNFIKRVTLQTNEFPMVEFVPKQVQGLDGGIPNSGQRTFKLLGDATVRGATHPMTWDVTATFDGEGCQGQAMAPLKLSDFGLTPPKAGPVISVDDAGSIALSFQAAKSAA
jgi:polyisoprenoid-binding protein YceI